MAARSPADALGGPFPECRRLSSWRPGDRFPQPRLCHDHPSVASSRRSSPRLTFASISKCNRPLGRRWRREWLGDTPDRCGRKPQLPLARAPIRAPRGASRAKHPNSRAEPASCKAAVLLRRSPHAPRPSRRNARTHDQTRLETPSRKARQERPERMSRFRAKRGPVPVRRRQVRHRSPTLIRKKDALSNCNAFHLFTDSDHRNHRCPGYKAAAVCEHRVPARM